MKTAEWWGRTLLRALIGVAVLFAALSIWAQPRQADDWDLAWYLEHTGSLWRYTESMYLIWGGRVVPFGIGALSVSSSAATLAFKFLTIACFMIFCLAVHYLGTGTVRAGALNSRGWLCTAAVLWLGLPVMSDTVVQTTGAAGYLWPITAGLGFLCLYRRLREDVLAKRADFGGWLSRLLWLSAGVMVGLCNEQLFAGIVAVLAGWGWTLWRAGALTRVPARAWWGIAGLIAGTVVLVAAPGNYVRMEAAPDAPGIGSMLLRYVLYLGGAYFALGSGDAGRAFWLGILLIALRGVPPIGRLRSREALIWLAASFVTLLPMLPLVSFASPRTTFLAATFVVIAALNAFSEREGETRVLSWLVAFSLAGLVAVDGFIGWAANRSLSREMAERERILAAAAAEGRREAVVPYLATVPSRLTYMVNPQHDAVFIGKLAVKHGLAGARHDDSRQAPRPYTLNALKALRQSF
jgi:hypothetical protein